jgi:hypothetical protein
LALRPFVPVIPKKVRVMAPSNCHSQNRVCSQMLFAAVVPFFGLAFAGCYDGEALVQQARSSAVKTRLAEVDFGTFQTTLPRDAETSALTELKIHVFGTVPRYRVPDIAKQLKVEEYRLRAETLKAVRHATREELAEPNLTQLRRRIERVVNEILADAPVKSIGFYEVTFHQR